MEFLNQNRNVVIGVVVVVLIGVVFVIAQSWNTVAAPASSKPKALPPEALAEIQRQSHPR